jgi:hypothetical protein
MSFEMFAGDTKRINFTIIEASTQEAFDLTGATASWQASRARANGFSSTPVITKTEDNGLEITDVIGGAISVLLTPADTTNLSGDYYMELQLVDADGDIATAYSGTFTIKKALIRIPA